MRLPRLLFVTLLLGFALLPSLHAQSAASPYTVIVPVKDISEAQRDTAFATALGQVLARVAGGQDLRGKSGYDDAIKKAPGIVQQYQYQRSGAGVSLQVTFDQGAVQRAIAGMGVPSAGVKPPVLAIVRNAGGHAVSAPALSALVQAAAARGYTVITPSADDAPDAEALKKVDPAALAAVTQQYKTGLVLLGDLHDGGADWTLVNGGQPQSWQANAAANDTLLGDAGNSLADRLSKQLNVIGAGDTTGKLWVSGVRSAMDYAYLLALLRDNPAVHQVTTVGAHDDGMLLELKTNLPLDALATQLAANGRLIQGDAHDGAAASLRWVH